MQKYQIFDGEKGGLFDDYPVEEAKTGKQAIINYLKKTGRKYNLRRGADRSVMFSATPFYEKNGLLYKGSETKNKRVVWYKIV